MFTARVAAICRTLPGAAEADPATGEHPSWKVGGRMFACFAPDRAAISVKTDSVATATMLIDCGLAVRAPYFHPSWVRLPADTSDDDLRHRIIESWRIVVAGLPKALRP